MKVSLGLWGFEEEIVKLKTERRVRVNTGVHSLWNILATFLAKGASKWGQAQGATG